ncbi:hypothetical protein KY321_00440 [Candidatus Woesearchaeota archaeon]|nr:hypothetical protein [Candidatus Woesearchaeota archaeon]
MNKIKKFTYVSLISLAGLLNSCTTFSNEEQRPNSFRPNLEKIVKKKDNKISKNDIYNGMTPGYMRANDKNKNDPYFDIYLERYYNFINFQLY